MPAVTRSKSEKLPPPKDSNGTLEERPSKKTKTTSKLTRKQRKARSSNSTRARLSALPSMPLDIILQIFIRVPPSDLISVSRVNRAFRDLLQSPKSAFVWRQSFECAPGAPPCPNDMEIYDWACLLFGGANCYTCGAPARDAREIVFSLRRRMCQSCADTHLTAVVAPWLRDIVPYFHWDSLNSQHIYFPEEPLSARLYWRPDIRAVMKDADDILLKHGGRRRKAYKNEIAAYTAEREEAILERQEYAQMCEDFTAQARANEIAQIKAQRWEQIKARFLALGYTESDVDPSRRHRQANVAKPMSDEVWENVRPLLELKVTHRQAQRLQHEAALRNRDRRDFVELTYIEYVATLPVKLFPYIQPPSGISKNPIVIQAIEPNEPKSDELKDRLKAAILSLTPSPLAIVQDKINALASLIPAPTRAGLPPVFIPSLLTDEFYAGPAAGLGLATTFFTCCSPSTNRCSGISSGFDMLAHRHPKSQSSFPHADYCATAAEITRGLLGLLGLDPASSATDVDRVDPRFVCLDCPSITGAAGAAGHMALCWRAAVAHGRDAHHSARWRLVTGDEATRIPKAHDVPLVAAHQRIWGCGHCHFHLRQSPYWTDRAVVLDHLRTGHGTEEPLEGVDYFTKIAKRPTYATFLPLHTSMDVVAEQTS